MSKIAEEIKERKLRMLNEPRSIVIAPKMRESHMIMKIFFGFDKSVNKVRTMAGTFVSVPDVVSSLRKANSIIEKFESLIKSVGGDSEYLVSMDLDHSTAKAIAEKPSSYVVIPRTEEGRKMCLLVKRFDSSLLKLRTTCTDFTKTDKIFKSVSTFIADFHATTTEIASITKTDYKAPKGISAFISHGEGNSL